MLQSITIAPDREDSSICNFLLKGVNSVTEPLILKNIEDAKKAGCPIARILFKQNAKIKTIECNSLNGSDLLTITLADGNTWSHGAESARNPEPVANGRGNGITLNFLDRSIQTHTTVSSQAVKTTLLHDLKDHSEILVDIEDIENRTDEEINYDLELAVKDSPQQDKAKGHKGGYFLKSYDRSTKTITLQFEKACVSGCGTEDRSATAASVSRWLQMEFPHYVDSVKAVFN